MPRVVAEGLGEIRPATWPFATPAIFMSRPSVRPRTRANAGIIALHLDAKHHADKSAHFSSIDNGTAIAVYKGALYTASPDTLYRFSAQGRRIGAVGSPEIVIDGVPGRAAIAFDDKNNLFVAIGGGGNVCAPARTRRAPPSR